MGHHIKKTSTTTPSNIFLNFPLKKLKLNTRFRFAYIIFTANKFLQLSRKENMSDNQDKTITISLNKNILMYVLVGLLIVASFLIGYLWNKVQTLEKSPTAARQVAAPTAGAPTAPAANPILEGVTISDDEPVRGNRDANIAIIEYSDYECPFCARHHPTMLSLLEKYEGEIQWIYRHFPLTQLHPNAQKLAEAAECAAAQGGEDAFWAITDEMFNNTYTNSESSIKELANTVDLNPNTLYDCVASGEMEDAVSADVSLGSDQGVTGTPATLVLNVETGVAEFVSGAVPQAAFEAAIENVKN